MSRVIQSGMSYEDTSTGSACAFQIAAAWLDECLASHTKCQHFFHHGSLPPPLPTRVIDVGSSSAQSQQPPKLYIADGDDVGFYFTLSYRWLLEGNEEFQTTRSRLDEYCIALPLLSLPQTMQDAISITRNLGVRYLWIDALCIVQDSEEDWRTEAKAMARVYQNGLLTIAASASADQNKKSGGCIRTRKRQQVRPLYCSAAWPDGMPKYIFADRRASKDGTRPRSTLDTRGWVLQEQLLSPRVLSYADQELYWDCISLSASESFPSGIPGFYDPGLKVVDMLKFRSVLLRSQQGQQKHDKGSEEEGESQMTTMASKAALYSLWRKVVEEYSMRRLTHNTDKLVALLGVAKGAASILEDEFMDGLWRKMLWRDLLWWVKDSELSSPQRAPVAPTWSWASLDDAAVTYDLSGSDTEADMVPCVEVIEVGAASEESFGLPRITGEIVLRGRLVPLLGTDGSAEEPSHESFPQWSEDVHGTDVASVWALVVAASEFNTYGIAITKMGEAEEQYKRVGRLYWRTSPAVFGWDPEKKGWSDETQLTSVTLL
ncbi:heterokaryon incompatibility protein-domain-containing protein [Apodospora peruviana]|uniref:Heterokaryon incompatibility protein-domain-containing protein n=1 Tax=Apodospora peruviana TaxID=516989 RepID=A0AAE0MH34_9PEZI|nr:heterokaryon incompatibility protein-domain-containing protein [Apodospora peruviana]